MPAPDDGPDGGRFDARLDFCTETVSSHHSKVDLVLGAVSAGYDVVLHVVMIPLVLSGPEQIMRCLVLPLCCTS